MTVQVMVHNLARWTGRIGLGERAAITTKTLRQRIFALVGRITRKITPSHTASARRWPWEIQFSSALAQLRPLPLPS